MSSPKVLLLKWSCGKWVSPLRESPHRLKYRLALVVAGECILRYDNEAGKGDHRHVGNVETQFAFRSYEQLLTDFWADVDEWRRRK